MQPSELPDQVLVAIKLLYDAEKRGALDEYPEIKIARELMIPISVYLHQDIMSAMAIPKPEQKVSFKEQPLDSLANPMTNPMLVTQMGFTGDICEFEHCRQMTMVRNGTCLKCMTCGGTNGCS